MANINQRQDMANINQRQDDMANINQRQDDMVANINCSAKDKMTWLK